MRGLLLLALLAVGCSSKKSEPTPTAEKAQAATPKPAKERIVGSWKIDLAALGEAPELKQLDPQARQKRIERVWKSLQHTRFTFEAEGAFKVKVARGEQRGTWSIAKATDAELTLKTTVKEGEAERSDEVRARFDGDRLVLTGPDGKPLTFERAKE